MLEALSFIEKNTHPGQVLLTVRPLPGCHLGWLYLKRVLTETTYAEEVEVHIYLRTPIVHSPALLSLHPSHIARHTSDSRAAFKDMLVSVQNLADPFRAAEVLGAKSGASAFRLGMMLSNGTEMRFRLSMSCTLQVQLSMETFTKLALA